MKFTLKLLPFLLLSLFGTCQTTHKAILSWPASPTTNATYTIYRAPATSTNGTITPGTFVVLSSNVTALTFTDSGLAGNTSLCYQVTATATGDSESAPTAPACGTTGKDQTSPPAGTLTLTIQ